MHPSMAPVFGRGCPHGVCRGRGCVWSPRPTSASGRRIGRTYLWTRCWPITLDRVAVLCARAVLSQGTLFDEGQVWEFYVQIVMALKYDRVGDDRTVTFTRDSWLCAWLVTQIRAQL